MNFKEISNISDCEPLYIPQSLYLKPYSKFEIKVNIPKGNAIGKTISNFEIVEHIKNALKPEKLDTIKATKSTLKVITFEAEIDHRKKVKHIMQQLNKVKIYLKDFKEPFVIETSDINDFPTRHEWDTYFRDSDNMDEMKAGERPDTILLSNLPIRWFCPRHKENEDNVKPSESIFKRIFEKFGSVRCIDIPICDPFRSQMKTEIAGVKTPYIDDTVFTGYVQFSEYVGFVRAMDAFRSMRLVRKCVNKNFVINIHVTFDKTKHLSDANIKRRKIVRDRLIAQEKKRLIDEEKSQQEKIENTMTERKKYEEKKVLEINEQKEREDRRKQKFLKKLEQQGQLEVSSKIRHEQRKMIVARRKLESIRILDAIFERLRIKEYITDGNSVKQEDDDSSRKRLVSKYKVATEELLQQQQQKFEEVKAKSGLMAIIKKKRSKPNTTKIDMKLSSDDEFVKKDNTNNAVNPFVDVCTPELAREWLKMNLLSNFQYYQPFLPFPSYRSSFHNSRGRAAYRVRSRGSYRRINKYSYDEGDRSSARSYRNIRRSRSRSQTPKKKHYSRSRSHSRSRSKSRRRNSYSSFSNCSSNSKTGKKEYDKYPRNHRYKRSRSTKSSDRGEHNKKDNLCSTRRSRSSSGWSRSRSTSRDWGRREKSIIGK